MDLRATRAGLPHASGCDNAIPSDLRQQDHETIIDEPNGANRQYKLNEQRRQWQHFLQGIDAFRQHDTTQAGFSECQGITQRMRRALTQRLSY